MRIEINSSDYFKYDNHDNEVWNDVKGFECLYQISNYSRVRSLKTNKILKCGIDEHGYYVINLYDKENKKRRYVSLHRLLAENFIPNLENKSQVNHKDGVKANCYLYNLEWNTPSENTQHAYDNGLTRLKKGDESPNAIPISQYSLDGKFIKHWGSATSVRNKLGINKSNIIQCCKGKVKQAGGFKWRYKKEGDI